MLGTVSRVLRSAERRRWGLLQGTLEYKRVRTVSRVRAQLGKRDARRRPRRGRRGGRRGRRRNAAQQAIFGSLRYSVVECGGRGFSEAFAGGRSAGFVSIQGGRAARHGSVKALNGTIDECRG